MLQFVLFMLSHSLCDLCALLLCAVEITGRRAASSASTDDCNNNKRCVMTLPSGRVMFPDTVSDRQEAGDVWSQHTVSIISFSKLPCCEVLQTSALLHRPPHLLILTHTFVDLLTCAYVYVATYVCISALCQSFKKKFFWAFINREVIEKEPGGGDMQQWASGGFKLGAAAARTTASVYGAPAQLIELYDAPVPRQHLTIYSTFTVHFHHLHLQATLDG